MLLSGCKLWVGTAGKVNSYKCVLSLTECCDCYTGHHVLFDWEALVMNVNSWMYASHVIIGIFLLFLQAPKWKQVARQSQDRPDNFETFTRQTGWELSQDRLENFVTIYHKTDWWLSQDRQENFVTITRQTGELSASFISLCHLVLCLKSILTEKLRINNNSLLDGLQELVYARSQDPLQTEKTVHKIVYTSSQLELIVYKLDTPSYQSCKLWLETVVRSQEFTCAFQTVAEAGKLTS